MNKYESDADLDLREYEQYFSSSNRLRNKKRDRKARPARGTAVERAELSDVIDDISDFVPSYAAALDPLHYERQWLINSVAPFYHDKVITDVTQRVKGGKEANVYCCTAHPATGMTLIAAKLYRPRVLRMLKNDAIYKSGRALRGEDGKLLKGRREKLAIRQKSTFGRRLDMEWWIGNEFTTQKKLHEAGADVPRPIAHIGNTILMEYVGDERLPAPALIDVSLEAELATGLFKRVMDNVQLMLNCHFVHGDLSAYNILFWQDEISIIDFPQMVDARSNEYAYDLFQRDILRVSQYFGRFGVQTDSNKISRTLWADYMGPLALEEYDGD